MVKLIEEMRKKYVVEITTGPDVEYICTVWGRRGLVTSATAKVLKNSVTLAYNNLIEIDEEI